MTMARPIGVIIALGLLAAAAQADLVVLNDGRTFSGVVTIDGDTVVVTMAYASLRFPKEQVARIVPHETPEGNLAKRLAGVDANDPDALYELAEWAADNALPRRARALYARVLRLDADHAGAHRALGHVALDGRWLAFDEAVELARSRLAAGRHRMLRTGLLPTLEDAARRTNKAKLPAVRRLIAHAQLRSGDFAQAAATFKALADQAPAAAGLRYATIAGILADHPDGMYVLAEPYPAAATLLDKDPPALTPGPASLADPLVLQAALLDRAKAHVAAGREIMDEAQTLEATDPASARARYLAAGRALDKADALVEGISRSHRVQIARRQIRSLWKDVRADGERLQEEVNALGVQRMSPTAYRRKVQRMLYLANRVRSDLQDILKVAEPYPRELIVMAKTAERRLETMDRMRQRLAGELDDKH
jgi:hypothetical protein